MLIGTKGADSGRLRRKFCSDVLTSGEEENAC